MSTFKERYFPFKEFPQQVLGYHISRLWKERLINLNEREKEYLYGLEKLLREKTGWNDIKIFISDYYSHKSDKVLGKLSGFSIGHYICLNNAHDIKTLRHELGHCIQSQELGWLYLPVIGLPSATRNVWDRYAHKTWTSNKRFWWYYNHFPEKTADKNGNVTRPWDTMDNAALQAWLKVA